MKEVLLCADGDCVVYSVPDAAADHLEEYCMEFCARWLHRSPDAAKYRTEIGVCYTEADFIDYLNRYVFPHEKSVPVRNLGRIEEGQELSERDRGLPSFRF